MEIIQSATMLTLMVATIIAQQKRILSSLPHLMAYALLITAALSLTQPNLASNIWSDDEWLLEVTEMTAWWACICLGLMLFNICATAIKPPKQTPSAAHTQSQPVTSIEMEPVNQPEA